MEIGLSGTLLMSLSHISFRIISKLSLRTCEDQLRSDSDSFAFPSPTNCPLLYKIQESPALSSLLQLQLHSTLGKGFVKSGFDANVLGNEKKWKHSCLLCEVNPEGPVPADLISGCETLVYFSEVFSLLKCKVKLHYVPFSASMSMSVRLGKS